MTDKTGFYCVNFKDEDRRNKMTTRFQQLCLPLNFVDHVSNDDVRLEGVPERVHKRAWSIMLQHMDSIRHFVEDTQNDFCIVMEDDILVSKDIVNDLQGVIETYNKLQLDVLLLGYLIPFKIHDYNPHFPLKERNDKYSYYDFPSDLWGSQMYMISRNHAINLLERYTIEHAIETIESEPFSPDWTLTKYGKKAIIYPMIAVEEGGTKADLYSESQFHLNCYLTNYVEGLYL
jgi:GR25 family glycosyltransferase involved in LPS biosynthesis